MPNGKQMSKARRIELVREARAGLIPVSDDVEDERRVRTNLTARMILAVKTHLGSVTRVSDDLAITNILSDLRHYCDCNGLVYKKLDGAAYALYSEEKADEAAWSTPPVYLEGVMDRHLTRRMRRQM
jgi:hypothetical protein